MKDTLHEPPENAKNKVKNTATMKEWKKKCKHIGDNRDGKRDDPLIVDGKVAKSLPPSKNLLKENLVCGAWWKTRSKGRKYKFPEYTGRKSAMCKNKCKFICSKRYVMPMIDLISSFYPLSLILLNRWSL